MKLIRKDYIYFFILSILILSLYRCFYYIGLSAYTQYMGLVALLIYVYMFLSSFKTIRKNEFRVECLILIGILITYFVSIITYNEGIRSFPRYMNMLSIIVFFYLVQKNVRSNIVEYVMAFVAILYIMCWIYQVNVFPNIVFGEREGLLNTGRGFVKFWIVTKEHVPFLLFYFLSLYINKRKIIFLIFAIIIYGVIILHVGRQMIVWSGSLALLFYFFCNNKKRIRGILILLVLLYVGFSFFVEHFSVLNDLKDLTKSSKGGDNSFGFDNIRFSAMLDFIKHYNDNLLTIIWGSGYPSGNGMLLTHINSFIQKGYYLDDVGFVAMYCNTGLWSVVLYVILLYKIIFTTKVSEKYVYLKFYIVCIILTYLGSHALTSNLVFVIMAIYILKRNSLQKEKTINI